MFHGACLVRDVSPKLCSLALLLVLEYHQSDVRNEALAESGQLFVMWHKSPS